MKFSSVVFGVTLLFATAFANANIPMEYEPPTRAAEMFNHYSFEKWRNKNDDNRQNFKRFEKFLRDRQVINVVPTYQLLRTASDAGICNESAFEIPPDKFWDNIVVTLEYIRDYVKPELGALEAMSGYRNPELNTCASGAPRSSHTEYFALDLVPVHDMPRKELFYKICRAHEKHGEEYNIGLGFYSGLRFHVDSRSYRRWGFNGRGITSPCVYYDEPPEDDAVNATHATQ
jgi:hypothetical protein